MRLVRIVLFFLTTRITGSEPTRIATRLATAREKSPLSSLEVSVIAGG